MTEGGECLRVSKRRFRSRFRATCWGKTLIATMRRGMTSMIDLRKPSPGVRRVEYVCGYQVRRNIVRSVRAVFLLMRDGGGIVSHKEESPDVEKQLQVLDVSIVDVLSHLEALLRHSHTIQRSRQHRMITFDHAGRWGTQKH